VVTLVGFNNEPQSIDALNADYEARYQQRNRLGLSQIGHECPVYLWCKHNCIHGKPPEGRVLRLFQLGNVIEDELAIDLKSAGFILYGEQRYIEFTNNNLKLHGSCDGIIEGLLESSQPHLWECKSMASKGFKKLLQHGYEAYNTSYKTQVHVYMLGLKLKRAFVTVYNKDTSELYQERIKLDKQYAIKQLQRAFEIMEMSTPPDKKICPGPSFYKAKWCEYERFCFK